MVRCDRIVKRVEYDRYKFQHQRRNRLSFTQMGTVENRAMTGLMVCEIAKDAGALVEDINNEKL